jgi:hypothetical protein
VNQQTPTACVQTSVFETQHTCSHCQFVTHQRMPHLCSPCMLNLPVTYFSTSPGPQGPSARIKLNGVMPEAHACAASLNSWLRSDQLSLANWLSQPSGLVGCRGTRQDKAYIRAGTRVSLYTKSAAGTRNLSLHAAGKQHRHNPQQ